MYSDDELATRMFIKALFKIIVKDWKQPKCPPNGDLLYKSWSNRPGNMII